MREDTDEDAEEDVSKSGLTSIEGNSDEGSEGSVTKLSASEEKSFAEVRGLGDPGVDLAG